MPTALHNSILSLSCVEQLSISSIRYTYNPFWVKVLLILKHKGQPTQKHVHIQYMPAFFCVFKDQTISLHLTFITTVLDKVRTPPPLRDLG